MRLLERDEDLAALSAAFRRAQDGRGGMVIVRGESGAGKTSLLQSFRDDRLGEVPVLWGACDPLATPRPLGPLHDLAPHLGDEVGSILRTASQPHEIFAAVFDHLRLHPSVLVIDDLHWADQGTIDLLRFLLRRIRITGSVVIGATRDDELGAAHPLRSLLGDVARSPDADSTSLQPLSLAAVATLAEDRSVDPQWLHQLTAGNPFFVVEMLDHDGEEIPRNVRDAILARAHGLPAEAWDLLHLLACAPEAIADRLLAPLDIGLPALRVLDLAGLVRRGPRGVTFRHDLCRTAISETLPPGGEVSFHRRMLEALEASPPSDPAVLTHHAVGAGDVDRILRHATDAGRAAARSGAHTQAAAFYRTALERGAPSTAEEAELLELLADEQYLIDRLDDAIAASERAMALRERISDPVGVSVNHHALSLYHWYNANRQIAERHATAAEAVLAAPQTSRSEDDLRHLGHALAMQAFLAFQASDVAGARLLLERAAVAGAGADDPSLAVRLRLLRGMCDVLEGESGSREATLAIVRAAHEHLDEIHSSAYSSLTYLDVEQRRLHHAAELLGFTLPLTMERDLPICRVWQMGSRGRMKLLRGDWTDALADADVVLTGPSAPLARTWPHLVRGLVALRRGGDADADLEQAWALARRFDEPIRLLPAAAALVERSWLRGIADERLEECRSLLAGSTEVGLEWARGELATWLHRLDAERGADPTIEVARGTVAEPFALQLAGRNVEAAATWSKLGAPYDQALALIDAGTPESIRTGLDVLDRLGADEVAAKVRHDLRRRGATTVPSRRRAATRENPAGLTARQVEIVRLLADGSTNAEIAQRLFLSTKTVEHHVSAVLAKLQAPNRRDAARRAAELGILA